MACCFRRRMVWARVSSSPRSFECGGLLSSASLSCDCFGTWGKEQLPASCLVVSALKAEVKSRHARRGGEQTFCRCHDVCAGSALTLFHVHLVSIFVPKVTDAFTSPKHPLPVFL